MTRWPRRLQQAGSCAALLLLYMWPAVYNGQPFFFPDTTAYVRGADAGFSRLTHRTTVWSESARPTTGARAAEAGPARRPLSSIEDKAVLAGRSIYYGGLLYLSHVAGRLWPATLVQAGAALLAIGLTLRAFGSFTWLRLSVVSLVLAGLTPLPFFVSFLMPDVFASLAILAVTNLLVHWDGMSRWVVAAWGGLLASAVLFHTSHVAISLGLLAIAVPGMLLLRVPVRWPAAAITVAAVAVGLAGEAAFNAGVEKLVGSAPIRPPFLMARLIADGTGYRYLVATCPGSGLAVCRFVDRLPIADPNDFLWDPDPAKGVFAVSDPATRRQLASEQGRFVRGTLAFDPWGQLKASAGNVWSQITRMGLPEFRYDANGRAFMASHVPEPYLGRMMATKAWHEATPTRAVSVAAGVTALLAFLYLVGWAVVRGGRAGERWSLAFAGLVLAGVLVNAAVCGVLSTPRDRYQARVVWLLPLTAMLVHLRSRHPMGSAPRQRIAS